MTNLDWATERNRRAQAADLASEILDALGVSTAPVDPIGIAESEAPRLKVRGADFRNRFDGQLEYHPGHDHFLLFYNTKYDVGYPPRRHHPRTRFSISHELGHFYIDEHRAYLMRGGAAHGSQSESFASDVNVEREADAFAAGLLLPTKLLSPMVNEAELTLAEIERFARHFEASLVSTAIRSVELSDFPCAVAGIREGQLAWLFPSTALVKGGCYPGPKGALQSESARKQWAAFTTGATTKAKAEQYARCWFRTYDREDLEQLPVSEHYLPVRAMDTLIVLLTVPEDELFPGADDY
jgi:Zn-dependent peptidase ImmA (M78 family)